VDDHVVVAQAFRLVLESAGMEVVGGATTGAEAIEASINLEPDVVLLDIVMPKMDGLAALSVIKHLRPNLPVLMLTSRDEKVYMVRAMELGAAGFISKGVAPDFLVKTIRDVVTQDVTPDQQPPLEGPRPPSVPGFTIAVPEIEGSVDLTDQEKLILTYLSTGYSSQAITEQLSISANTLKTHLGNIYEKLGVSNRVQAVIWAIRHGLTMID